MYALLATIIILIIIFFLSGKNPFIAGLVAVIPVKIIATGFINYSNGSDNFLAAIKGMLIGQFLWGFILLIIYLLIYKTP